jgi:hypothetical protein
MFWQSILQGLFSLTYWEIWIGMVAVGLAQIVFTMLIGLLVMPNDSGAGATAGCLLQATMGPVIQALAVTAFIVLLLPAILLGRGFTSPELVAALAVTSLKYGLLALLFVFVLSLIPFIGGIVSKTPGLATFLQGVLIFKPISRILLYSLLDRKPPNDIYPGFWACVAYFIIACVLIWIAFVVVSLIADKIKERRDPVAHMLDRYRDEPTTFQLMAIQFLGPMLGIIPLLMYGKYVALNVRALVTR